MFESEIIFIIRKTMLLRRSKRINLGFSKITNSNLVNEKKNIFLLLLSVFKSELLKVSLNIKWNSSKMEIPLTLRETCNFLIKYVHV